MENNGKKFKAYVYMLIPDCEEARANGDDKKMYIGQTDDIKKRQGDWRDLSTPYAGKGSIMHARNMAVRTGNL